MKLSVKCWKTKNGTIAKALCYIDNKGREQVATFDKWFIGALLGSMKKYYLLAEGDCISCYLYAQKLDEAPCDISPDYELPL